jgi:hypothetical protein
MNTNEDLALAEAFASIVPQPEYKIEYRLYYDNAGKPTCMSSNNHPEGQYVIIDKATYDRAIYNNLKVVNGTLITIDTSSQHRVQLQKVESGPFRTAKNNAGILLTKDEQVEQTDYYDHRNN